MSINTFIPDNRNIRRALGSMELHDLMTADEYTHISVLMVNFSSLYVFKLGQGKQVSGFEI